MKKLLLSCFLALGIGAHAQYNYTGGFEEDEIEFYGQFGGGTVTAAAACAGSWGGQLATSTTYANTGWMLMLDELELVEPTQTNNGQAATVTMKYKKASGPVGAVMPALFTYSAESDMWNIELIGTPVNVTSGAVSTCGTLTGSIPAGKMQPGTVYAVGLWYERTSGSGNIFVDDISIVQEIVNTAPGCTTFTNPANPSGDVVSAGGYTISWTAAPTAVNYKLKVGTTSGGTDIFNGTVAGTSQAVPLAVNTAYFATVTPSNLSGDASGCTEISFSTNNNIVYCTAGADTAQYDKITNVTFADINNNSPAGTPPGYEDFTSVVGTVKMGSTYAFSASSSNTTYATDQVLVWIDYNKNGIFGDEAKENVLVSAKKVSPWTGNITIPTDVPTGTTRMRVRVHDSGDAQANATSCGNSSYGQVEDYTLNVIEPAIPSCVTITSPADGATNVPLSATDGVTVTWNADPDASGYTLSAGTTPGGNEIFSGVTVTTTSFNIPGLAANTQYYVKVVPTNFKGDAVGCTESTFTTGSAWIYCAATHSTINADRITRVQFSDIDQTSAATPTGGYSDYTAVKGKVTEKSTYPIVVTITAGNANDKAKVWIDYNQNGIFEDSEMTILTKNPASGSATSATGDIVIPEGAKSGDTRMRIRMSRQGNINSIVACGNISAQGETEDYTVTIEAFVATANVAKGAVSVYPNPFADVLKISDVKNVKSVSVSDASGRQVRTLKPSAELNLSSLTAGVYVVTLHMNDGSVKTFKTIKK